MRETLRQGLDGWEVLDCAITLTKARFQPPESAAGHFRDLASILTAEALREAGTVVCEPIHHWELEAPADALSDVLAALRANRGRVNEQAVIRDRCRLAGTIPASKVHSITQQLPGITHGEGFFASDFHGYQPVVGPRPTRPRIGPNPYDRDQYMLHVLRSMS